MRSPEPATRRVPGRVGTALATVSLLVGAPALLGVAWLVASAAQSPLATDRQARPVIVEVASGTRTDDLQVQVQLVPAQARSIESPATGRVTNVSIAAGDTVRGGDVVISVDDHPLVVFTAVAPLWRDIGPGIKGEDVARAQMFLTALGYSGGKIRGTVGGDTVDAIRHFHRDRGMDQRDGVLHVTELVWIGPEPVPVKEVGLDVGSAVNVGDKVFSVPSRPATVTVRPVSGVLPATDLELLLGEAVVRFAGSAGSVETTADVAAIEQVLAGQTEMIGNARRTSPVPVGVVPATALVTDRAGRTCMFLSEGSEPVAVVPGGGTVVSVDVEATWVGRKILANPHEILKDPECG